MTKPDQAEDKTMANHTPTPWMTDGVAVQPYVNDRGRPTSGGAIGIFAGPSGIACTALVVPGCLPAIGREDAAKANAHFIVRAVNSHEALVAALKEAERFMAYFAHETDGVFVGPGTPTTCLAQIRASLSQARA